MRDGLLVNAAWMVALGLGASGCFFGGGDVVCPDGWSYDDATTFRCEPDAAELAQIDAEIDTGAYGWVRSIEGGCGPGDSTCSVRPLAGHRLHFAPQELCDWSTLSDLSDEALGDLPTAVTDERGVYQVELPFGGQCAISTDTVTGERTMTGVVSIIDTVLTPVDVAYDHGAY